VSASLNNSGQFVVATDHTSGVVLYDSTGKQIRKIGDIGRGPAEYVSPGIVKFIGDTIYIWDEGLLKFLKFNTQNELLLEIAEFRWALQDFTVYGTDIFMYNSGKSSGAYIEQYHLNQNKYGKSFGQSTQEHIVLMTLNRAGGMDSRGDYLYYVSPSKLSIYRIDLKNYKKSNFPINDEDFKVPEVDNARKIIMDIEKATEFITSSSVVTGIHLLDDYIVMIAEIGQAQYNKQYNAYLTLENKVRFYVLEYNMQLIDTFTFAWNTKKGGQFKIWGSNGEELFFLSTTDLFGEPVQKMNKMMPYHLYRWKIKKIEQ
ncbi:MAG: 6-bladed beta-propeller, partial [Balneolaceae bacterium]|nr:6-bladed beta-propeller [Balneolaceae bacterium]